MPPATTSRLAQYARGQSDTPVNQQSARGTEHQPTPPRNDAHASHASHAYYPPASNATARTSLNIAGKSSYPKTSPRKSRPRDNSFGSMGTLPDPPAHALPSKPGAASWQRVDSDSNERYPVSLPSNLATPWDSPEGADEPEIARPPRGNDDTVQPAALDMAAVQQASDNLAPFVNGDGGLQDMVPSNTGPSLFRHHSMREQGHTAPTTSEYAQRGFFEWPNKRTIKLAVHDGSHGKSYAEAAHDPAFPEDLSHGPSATLEGSPRGRRKYNSRVAGEAQGAAMFRDDGEEYGDLTSEFPLSDTLGTPRTPRAAVGFGEIKREMQPPSPPNQTLKSLGQVDGHDGGRAQLKRRHDDLDYDEAVLQRMDYSELKSQPFDADPGQAPPDAVNGAAAGDSLPDRLQHYKGRRVEEQEQFFSQMSLQDWESSGDWFLEKFAQLTNKLKQARQEKRATVERFEAEIADREEAVRARTEALDKKLDAIKSKGEAIVGGQDV